MSELVSVIIPTYNCSKYVTEAINSVLEQTYNNYEIIVIDDGSTDDTEGILSLYMDKIRYVKKGNGGPASARNLGIKESKGEYVAFLDADDLWDSSKLEKQIALFDENLDLGLVHTALSQFIASLENMAPSFTNSVENNNDFKDLFWHNFIGTSTVLVRKECFEKLGTFNEGSEYFSVEDYDMWLRIAQEYKIGYVADVLTFYRQHPDGISKNIDRSYNNERAVIEAAINRLPDLEKETGVDLRKRFSKLYQDYGFDFLENMDFKNARERLLKSVGYNIFNVKSWGGILKTFVPLRFYGFLRNFKRKLN